MLDNGFSAFTASTTNFESNFDTPQAIRRITTTTKIVNGKKISTKKCVPENEINVSFFLNQSINQLRGLYRIFHLLAQINQSINHWIILARYLIYWRKLIDIERWLVYTDTLVAFKCVPLSLKLATSYVIPLAMGHIQEAEEKILLTIISRVAADFGSTWS